MNLDDAIAHFSSRMNNAEHTAFFFVGDLADAYSASENILDDLHEECASRIPAPFKDTTVIGKHEASSGIGTLTARLGCLGFRRSGSTFLAFRFVSQSVDSDFAHDIATVITDPAHNVPEEVKARSLSRNALQQFEITALGPHESFTWVTQFMGIDRPGGIATRVIRTFPITHLREKMVWGSSSWLRLLAMISHPSNYIVRESPLLTPKEARRVERGKNFPSAKRPRYIIVDHDVLINRMKPTGSHASPVPHQRRGHWMRLSERCKHMKSRGVQKVWVRDCNVGETDFTVCNRRYQVLLDFPVGS